MCLIQTAYEDEICVQGKQKKTVRPSFLFHATCFQHPSSSPFFSVHAVLIFISYWLVQEVNPKSAKISEHVIIFLMCEIRFIQEYLLGWELILDENEK